MQKDSLIPTKRYYQPVRGMVAGLLLGMLAASPGQASVISTFVDSQYSVGSAGYNAEYDFASVSIYVDPSQTNWIAWNNLDDVTLTAAARPGETFLGPGGFGTDDYIILTVTNPDGVSQGATLDFNNASGVSSGVQNVIFGTAADAPDAYRHTPPWGGNYDLFFDEAGILNALFTSAGTYQFDFSFRNYTGSAGHQDTWLLMDVNSASNSNSVSEPTSLALTGLGIAVISLWRRKKRVFGQAVS